MGMPMIELESVINSVNSAVIEYFVQGFLAAVLSLIMWFFSKRSLENETEYLVPTKKILVNAWVYEYANKVFLRWIVGFTMLFLFSYAIIYLCWGHMLLEICCGISYIISIVTVYLWGRNKSLVGLNKQGEYYDYKNRVLSYIVGIGAFLVFVTLVKNKQDYCKFLCIIIEIVIFIIFAKWILYKKEVRWYDTVEIEIVNRPGRMKVAIENFKVLDNHNILIMEPEEGNTILNAEQIVDLKMKYADEYIEWTKKMEKAKRKTEQKTDNDISYIFLFVMVMIPLIVMFIEKKTVYINWFNRRNYCGLCTDLFSQQMTITTIFISVISLLVNNINDRFVNVSVKRIFFRNFIYRPNYLSMVLAVLLLDVLSFVAYLFECRCSIVVIFCMASGCLFWLLKMTYQVVSKKSRIYKKIYDELNKECKYCKKQKRNVDDLKVYGILLKKISYYDAVGTKNGHNSYLIKELKILAKMSQIANTMDEEMKHNYIINRAVKVVLNGEKSGKEALLAAVEECNAKNELTDMEKMFIESKIKQK